MASRWTKETWQSAIEFMHGYYYDSTNRVANYIEANGFSSEEIINLLRKTENPYG